MPDPHSSDPSTISHLDPYEWEALWRAFETVSALAPSSRPDAVQGEFVDAAPERAALLRSELLEMLEGEDADARLLIERELDASQTRGGRLDLDSASPERPISLGSYSVIDRIGHGGMGEVFLARREGSEYEQLVAIKVLRRGLDTELMLERFRLERDVLVRLDHPAVAPLLDAGTTPDGRPYLVLRYVTGRPITEHCSRAALEREEILELFIALCRVVQFAHNKLVVHRDLKPSNVLVTDDGELQLLDFGVAKLLDPEIASDLTEANHAPMTHRRAAPEQIAGEGITTATDIWALGVLLHELLTGALPDHLHTAPLTNTTSLDRDLGAIVHKCLRRDPERRYASAEHLAEDLRRYLRQEPVLARPPLRSYRVGRFLLRHRFAVAALTLLAVSLATFAVTSAVQARRLAVERDRATEEQRKSESTLNLLVTLLSEADPYRSGGDGDTIDVERFLERVAAQAESMGDEPLLQAQLRRTVGTILYGRGDYQRAEAQARLALEGYRRVLGEDHEQTLRARLDLADLEHRLRGDMERAREQLRSLVEQIRPRADEFPRLAADVYRSLGSLSATDEGEQLILTAVRLYRSLPEVEPELLASTLSNLATLRSIRGNAAGAQEALRESIALYRELENSDAIVLSLRSALATYPGDPQERYAEHRAILEERIRVLGDDHPHLGNSYRHLAAAALELGRAREAVDLLRRSWRLWAEGSNANPAQAHVVAGELAEALNLAGEIEEARRLYDEILPNASARRRPRLMVDSALNHLALGDVGSARRELSPLRTRAAEGSGALSGLQTDVQLALVRAEILDRSADWRARAREAMLGLAAPSPKEIIDWAEAPREISRAEQRSLEIAFLSALLSADLAASSEPEHWRWLRDALEGSPWTQPADRALLHSLRR